MIYEQKVKIPSATKIVKHTISNCVKCGNDVIKIEEYEDKYGFISTMSCKNKNCKNEVKVNADEIAVIKEWNKQNNISTLIRNKKKLIADTQSEIKRLMKLKTVRGQKKNKT